MHLRHGAMSGDKGGALASAAVRGASSKYESSLVAHRPGDPTFGLGDVALLRRGLALFRGNPRTKRAIEEQLMGALEALKSNRYILYRNRNRGDFCCRVTPTSLCYCGHSLMKHQNPWQDGRIREDQDGEVPGGAHKDGVGGERRGQGIGGGSRGALNSEGGVQKRSVASDLSEGPPSRPGGGRFAAQPDRAKSSTRDVQSAGGRRPYRSNSEPVLARRFSARGGEQARSREMSFDQHVTGRTTSASTSRNTRSRPTLEQLNEAVAGDYLRRSTLSAPRVSTATRQRSVSMHIGYETLLPPGLDKMSARPKSAAPFTRGAPQLARPPSSKWSKLRAAMQLLSVRFPDTRVVLHEDVEVAYERTGIDKDTLLSCAQRGCECERFQFIPRHPEEVSVVQDAVAQSKIGATWSPACKCGHSHKQHGVGRSTSCRVPKCVGCPRFRSSWLCPTCDKSWEEHVTIVETGKERRDAGKPCNIHYLPFSHNKSVQKNILDEKLKEFGRSRYGHLIDDPMTRALSGIGGRPTGTFLMTQGLNRCQFDEDSDVTRAYGDDEVAAEGGQ